MAKVKRIAALVSGGGTNLQAIIDAIESGKITNGKLCCVISSKEDAFALKRAQKHNIATRVIPRKSYDDVATYTRAIVNCLEEMEIDLVVYAGFMTILDEQIVKSFPNRMMNVHPALIPSFCGKGFYGLHVHEAVLASGVKLTGATVHFVTEVCDGGPIIMQKSVAVKNGDTPETLQKRVMEECEWDILPTCVSLFCNDKIVVENGIANIID